MARRGSTVPDTWMPEDNEVGDQRSEQEKVLDRIYRINKILLAGEKPDKKQYRKKVWTEFCFCS